MWECYKRTVDGFLKGRSLTAAESEHVEELFCEFDEEDLYSAYKTTIDSQVKMVHPKKRDSLQFPCMRGSPTARTRRGLNARYMHMRLVGTQIINSCVNIENCPI